MNFHAMILQGDVFTYDRAHNTIYPFNHRAINGWTVERMLLCLFSKRPCNPVLNKKRYLVTGGGGFIGSNLVEELAKSCFVTVVDNFSTGSIKNIDTNHPAIQVFDRDITKADWLDTFEQFNGIFHLAAMSKVAPSLGNPSMINYCTDVNVLATIHILHFARQHNPPIKVVYSASSTMYGNTTELPAKESSIPDCQTPYALSKYVGELYCEQFSRQYKVPTVRLRYFMVYGPREPSSGPYAVVSGIFLQRKRVNLPLTIHGDGSQTRDFVHVHDVVKANILAMTNDTLTNTTINVGTGKNISIQQIADWISENQFHTEPRAVDLRDTLADTSTCERLLGWKPERSIQDYLLEQKGVA